MKASSVSLALVITAAIFSSTALGQPAVKTPQQRIGQIFIIGNTRTVDDVILRQMFVYPGQILSYAELHQSQKNLDQLGIFKPGSVKVTVENDPNNPAGEYKNVFVRIEETSTGSLRLMSGLNCLGEPVVSVVWEERNFDPLRFPYSRDDLVSGDVFRGRGQLFRLELVQIPILSVCAPRFLQVGGFLVPVGG